MWTETPEGREYITAVSKKMVSEYAPEELELFDELIQDYFANPTPPDSSALGSDDELAFGVSEVVVAITPAAAAMVTAVLTYVLTEASEAIKDHTSAKIKEGIKGLVSPEKDKKGAKTQPDRPQPFSKEQLELIKKHAQRQAIKFGIKPRLANRMADALIGGIVLAI